MSPSGGTTYDPSNFGANNGTVVTFIFPSYEFPTVLMCIADDISCRDSAPNSVTQGGFDNPCVYLTASGGNPGGFDSGLQNGKLFSIRITNDQQRKQQRSKLVFFLVFSSMLAN